jgi:elongation factor G
MLLSGMGDQHLGIAIKRLKDSYKVEANTATPKIAYRETISGNGEAMYRHKKQTGGAGQFAEVHLRVTYQEGPFVFENAVVGGNIPKNFIPAVEKGVQEMLEKGPLVGCKVENVKVTVFDGKYHSVDSNEMAFKIASRAAFKEAVSKAHPIVLEPIMAVKIYIPNEYMGDISGDLNHKRGRIIGMESEEGVQLVIAEVPQAEMYKYATELRSMTQGRGSFQMELARYEPLPTNLANELIKQYAAENGDVE